MPGIDLDWQIDEEINRKISKLYYVLTAHYPDFLSGENGYIKVLLALLGWEKGSDNRIFDDNLLLSLGELCCHCCNRHIGIWNYKESNETEVECVCPFLR